MARFKSITHVEYIAFQETSRIKKSGAEFEVSRRLSRKYATGSVLVGLPLECLRPFMKQPGWCAHLLVLPDRYKLRFFSNCDLTIQIETEMVRGAPIASQFF